MQWEFDDVPITIRLPDGTKVQAGAFDGKFEIDDIGLIETIWLEEHVWPASGKTIELRRWKKGDKAPGFRTFLFDALAETLEKRFEDEIKHCLAEIRQLRTKGEIERADRAWFRQGLL